MTTRRKFFAKVGSVLGAVGLSKPMAPGSIMNASLPWEVASVSPPTAIRLPLKFKHLTREYLEKAFFAALHKLDSMRVLMEERHAKDDYTNHVLDVCFLCHEPDFSERIRYVPGVDRQVCEDCIPRLLEDEDG